MPLTRDFKDTVRARAARDPKFRKELLREGIECMLAGDTATAKTIPQIWQADPPKETEIWIADVYVTGISSGQCSANEACQLFVQEGTSYTDPTPYIPQAWSGVGWAFGQYTDAGPVSGISGNVDRDHFKNGGSYPDINALRIP